jgi:hypothetical protein
VRCVVPRWAGELPKGVTKADGRPAGLGPTNCDSWFRIFEDSGTINETVGCHCSDQYFRVRKYIQGG